MTILDDFAAEESGAVTVDWVVLTAAVVGLVLSVFMIITQASVSVGANQINDTLVAATNFARDPVDSQPVEEEENDETGQ